MGVALADAAPLASAATHVLKAREITQIVERDGWVLATTRGGHRRDKRLQTYL